MNRNNITFNSNASRIVLLAGVVMASLLAGCSNDDAGQTAAASLDKKILYWVAPMDPNYRRDKPGKSPMGMDLIPVYEEGESGTGDDAGGMPVVKIRPEIVNNMGVRTAVVKRDPLPRRIDTVGYVTYDEDRVMRMHARVEGWVERLAVKSAGERVRKGDLLFELYAPKLVSAQQEYLLAYNQSKAAGNGGTGVGRLLAPARERLRLLGVSEDQIKRLEKTGKIAERIRMRASQNGVVVELNIREGTYVTPKTAMLALADLHHVWIVVDVFDRQAEWVKLGQAAEVRLPYLPGRVWKGAVEYVYPDLDAKTRTLKARLRFLNPGEVLKPNMYGEVVIFGGDTAGKTLVIPREALIRTGKRISVVLALGEGRFRPVAVVPGIESGDLVEIREGLKEGDRVVVSGQFLIDSESSLKASFRRISEPETDQMAGTDDKKATP